MNINYFDFNSRINLKKGYLLLAQPLLMDSYFNRSVILICDHNKNGTIGLQINKPLKSNLKSIISKPLIDQKVFLGGPVDKNIFFVQGYSGHGVALTALAGKVMAEAINNESNRFEVLSKIKHFNFPHHINFIRF